MIKLCLFNMFISMALLSATIYEHVYWLASICVCLFLWWLITYKVELEFYRRHR